MGTHNICLYKEVDKKYKGCNLKTTELHDCVLIGVCAVIRLNTVFHFDFSLDQSKCVELLYACRVEIIPVYITE